MAAELICLEGGGPSATLVLGSPQMSAHLRVAQTSGTEVSGPGTGAGEGLTGVSGQGSCNFCDPGPSQLIFGLECSFIEWRPHAKN